MKTKKATMSLILGTFLLTTSSLLFVQKTHALPAAKHQLEVCYVYSGSTVTQVGDNCSAGGTGCTPNPCNN